MVKKHDERRGYTMNKLGLLGGMSYESTQIYYRIINQEINKKLKKSHSAELVMYSFDYRELEVLLEQNRWDLIEKRLIEEGLKLKSIGAKGLILCANTVHQVQDQVESGVGLPLISIVKETYEAVRSKNIQKVGLIGTLYTMKSGMYQSYFKEHGLEVVLPSIEDQRFIHHVIYQELVVGIYHEESRKRIIHIIESMHVDGIILGCTELPLLILDKHLHIHRFDTMDIHAKAAAKWMLEGVKS